MTTALPPLPLSLLFRQAGSARNRQKKTILGGLFIFVLAFAAYLITHILGIDALSGALIWVALIVGGAANMFITVNTLPLVLEIGGIDK